MNFKFKNADLPCNEKDDFNKKDTSVYIICRIFLLEAPSEEYEKIAKERDGDCYRPDWFFIVSVAGKNEEDEIILKSAWYLGYVYDSGNPFNVLWYASDYIDGAWEFFKKEIGIL